MNLPGIVGNANCSPFDGGSVIACTGSSAFSVYVPVTVKLLELPLSSCPMVLPTAHDIEQSRPDETMAAACVDSSRI